jgi:hypothetical protein
VQSRAGLRPDVAISIKAEAIWNRLTASAVAIAVAFGLLKSEKSGIIFLLLSFQSEDETMREQRIRPTDEHEILASANRSTTPYATSRSVFPARRKPTGSRP